MILLIVSKSGIGGYVEFWDINQSKSVIFRIFKKSTYLNYFLYEILYKIQINAGFATEIEN